MKEKEVFDAYQERSITAGERAEQLAWMMVLILCAALVGNKLITAFVISGAMSLVFFLLSALQSFWQAVGMWIVKQRIRQGKQFEDYPNWLGGGAWVFYILKMVAITIAVVYFVKDVLYLAF